MEEEYKRGCTGKVPYGRQETALKACAAMSKKTGDEYDAYECWYCNKWHIWHSWNDHSLRGRWLKMVSWIYRNIFFKKVQ